MKIDGDEGCFRGLPSLVQVMRKKNIKTIVFFGGGAHLV